MSRRTWIIGVSAVVALLVVGGGAFWYWFLRDDAPAEVSLDAAVEAISTSEAGGDSASGTPGASDADTGARTGTAPLDGQWALASEGDSFVGYRVNEELASIGFTTAVGRTRSVTVDVTIADGVLQSAKVEADMTRLQSDSAMRDRALSNQALETSRFPTATFELTSPVELPDGLANGEAMTLSITGNLTLHGVTREITVPVEAQFVDNYLVAVGSIDIVFADYDIQPPRAASVVSVEDHGVMELQLTLSRAS